MALRSLFISLAVTGFLGYSFTIGLTDPNSLLRKIPDWLSIPLLLGCGLLYLLAAWWAFKGFNEHKAVAGLSMGFCALGLGIYALGYSMEAGKGKAAKGQYDYDFKTLDLTETAVVAHIAHEAGLSLQDAVFTEHWHLADTTKSFRICVQKGHVTALNVSNHTIHDLSFFSHLPNLGDLILKNCNLSDLSGLKSTKLDRLDISDNQVADLKTLQGCPNVRWLFASNNKLTSTEGLAQFSQLVSKDLSGNPLPE
ncbi:leucine-rich repeat domain-containing protein [Larkinella rosea]|uniref:Leucine-rich repeat domain-containing protein n=1 Tax=Larkinella rosea TaxID=2025312 RepID=A0A3P1C2H9_9BACT|nr:leucine-rich repeat domain-containing protein [Larkinella rosea]RRB07263.1 leucine-rich repeat domain-containing protein [Larkinella rosea]